MTTLSTRLQLKKHTTADEFRIQDYRDNWDVLDNYPGIFICTSTTRPTTWGANQAGMHIFETDTRLLWQWTGTGWQRNFGTGYLGGTERTTAISTTSLTYVVVVSAVVTIPAGGRSLLVVAEGPGVSSTVGVTGLALYRGGTLLQEWESQGGGGTAANQRPRGLAMTARDAPAAGSHTFSLSFRAVTGFGGTSTLDAALDRPIGLSIVEV